MRVGVDARLDPNSSGGVAQVVEGLIEGFQILDRPDLDLRWMVRPEEISWLSKLGVAHASMIVDDSDAGLRIGKGSRTHVHRVTWERKLRKHQLDVLHAPFQSAHVSRRIPTVYQPHDLQHEHFPELFTKGDLIRRRYLWRARSHRAAAVLVGTQHVADDVHRFWGVANERIYVVPLAPSRKHGYREPCSSPQAALRILYPAALWPHKSHVDLIEACGQLIREGLDVELRLTGSALDGREALFRELHAQGLSPDRVWRGHVPTEDLEELWRWTNLLVVPSRYESASFPIWEAQLRGIPVVASDVTCLARQVGDAGLTFRPGDVEDLVAQLRIMLAEPMRRAEMGKLGRLRVADYSWLKTADATAQLYSLVYSGDASSGQSQLVGLPTLL